jgi:hypothetical protein
VVLFDEIEKAAWVVAGLTRWSAWFAWRWGHLAG